MVSATNQSLENSCNTKSLTTQVLEMTTLSIIGSVALLGNCLVIGVISRSHRVQWVTNLFVAHLAAVNLTVPVISAPFYYHWSLVKKWALGDTSCKLVNFSIFLNAGISSCMLACIAVDRYYVVVHPLTLHLRRSQTFQLITVIWTFVIFMCTPSLYFFKMKDTKCGKVCSYASQSDSWSGFFIAYSLCTFLVPLCIIIVLYVLIIKAIRERSLSCKRQSLQTSSMNMMEMRSVAGGAKYDQRNLGEVPKTKRKVIKMLVIQIILFIVCWLPYFVHEFAKLWSKLEYVPSTLFLWLCFSNASINPILYTILNSNFRKGCRHLVSLKISQPYTLQALQRKHQIGVAESSHRGSDDNYCVRESNMLTGTKTDNNPLQNGRDHLSSQLEDVSSIQEDDKKTVVKMFQISSNNSVSAWS